MEMAITRILLLILSTCFFGKSCSEKQMTEQERIQAYQRRIQDFMRSQFADDETYTPRTEPLQCYSCWNARSNEECNRRGMVTCSPTQTSCQTEIRIYNPLNMVNYRIRKGCKQERACKSNFGQNVQTASPSTQCNRMRGTVLSVCRYCCKDSKCNQALPDRICGQVPSIDHGSVTCKQNRVGSSVCTFRCNRCHRLTGSRVRMCLESAVWSGVETKCIYDRSLRGCQESTTCPAETVQPIHNGEVECSNENNPGSECRFLCDSGFILNGKPVLRCKDGEYNWDSDRPSCVAGDDTGNPCHIFASFQFTSSGQLLCDCKTGFVGDGFITCDDVDECTDGTDACDLNAVCINTVGSYRCECLPGYSGNGFACMDINECDGNNECDPENAICINNDGQYVCSCRPGFIGDGRTCERAETGCPGVVEGDLCILERPPGALSDTPEESMKVPVEGETIVFGELQDIENEPTNTRPQSRDGLEACVKVTEGTPVFVRDQRAYQSLNERLLRIIAELSNNTRLVGGPWIGLDDRLQPGVLRWRDGKKLSKNDFQAWAPGQPKMIDNKGFGNCVDLVSDPARTNTTDFMWQITLCSQSTRYYCESENNVFTDTIDICPPIVEVPNGQINCSDGWRNGSECKITCDAGFIMIAASNRITCDPTTIRWDKDIPTCTTAICGRPLMPPNSGVMECTDDNREGSVCRFSCKSGYNLHGNETVTCQENLKWSSRRPCCRDDCPPLARMNLIMVLDSSRSINATNFEKLKRFASQLHRRFEISEDFTHVSVITYHATVHLLNNVTAYTSSDELDIALEELPYEGAGTFIGQAIDFVTRNLVGLRDGSADVVVVLTDGISHDDVYFPSKRLRDAGAHVIAVGVEHAWNYQLNMIASEPTDLNVVQVDSFTDLKNVVRGIAEKVCYLSC